MVLPAAPRVRTIGASFWSGAAAAPRPRDARSHPHPRSPRNIHVASAALRRRAATAAAPRVAASQNSLSRAPQPVFFRRTSPGIPRGGAARRRRCAATGAGRAHDADGDLGPIRGEDLGKGRLAILEIDHITVLRRRRHRFADDGPLRLLHFGARAGLQGRSRSCEQRHSHHDWTTRWVPASGALLVASSRAVAPRSQGRGEPCKSKGDFIDGPRGLRRRSRDTGTTSQRASKKAKAY